ncbi:hypothetical protein ABK040_000306 [Willaertia magna]
MGKKQSKISTILKEQNAVTKEEIKPEKSQQSPSHHNFKKNITTVEYKSKEFLINDKSSFLNINKFKNMHCDITDTLTYVTNDGMGYIVKRGYPFLKTAREKDKDILYFINELNEFGVILFKHKVRIENKEINLPVIDCNDKFIQISCSSHKSFYFLLTANGKVFIYGVNADHALGILQFNENFKKFTLHPKLDHIKSKVVDIKCGYLFSVLRCENGDCYGAGYNCYVNIGVPGSRTMDVKEFTLIEQLKGRVKQHSCGNFHTVYLTFEGEVYGCGLNTSGQFGKTYVDKLYHYTDCIIRY